MRYLGVDIGGAWIRGIVIDEKSFVQLDFDNLYNFKIKKVKAPLRENATSSELIEVLIELIGCFGAGKEEIDGIAYYVQSSLSLAKEKGRIPL